MRTPDQKPGIIDSSAEGRKVGARLIFWIAVSLAMWGGGAMLFNALTD